MQIKLLFRLALAVIPFSAFGQHTYIRSGSPEYTFIQRLEIKTGLLKQSFVKPVLTERLREAIDSITKHPGNFTNLTAIDWHEVNQLARNRKNGATADSAAPSKTGGFIIVEPVVRIQYGKHRGSDPNPYVFSAGINMTGGLFKNTGFNLFTTANTERLPTYLSNWRARYNNSVPGIGSYRNSGNGRVSYLDIRGSIQTKVTRYIDLQLGYDRLFLGNGHRSLFLSDHSNNIPFFKISARIWKLDFQSLYMKLDPQDGIVNKPRAKKFLRLNTLGIEATRWLHLSFFDAVVLGRDNGFDLNYLMPLTFLRPMEQQSGSPDNALFGMNIKANISKRVQVYAQGLLDEFKLDEIKAGSGWWANKFGYQFGLKYVDALGIQNLDIQVETNRARPFTYTHFDSVSNYSHSNQPLAHPLGANFHEYIGILRYQPLKRLKFEARLVYYQQGLDSLGFNTGNNILEGYNTRPHQYGWDVGSGDKASCLYFQGSISYDIYRNLFLDLVAVRRQFETQFTGKLNTTLFTLGIRWNIERREFDY